MPTEPSQERLHGHLHGLVDLAITLVILEITWDSWRTVRAAGPGEPAVIHEH